MKFNFVQAGVKYVEKRFQSQVYVTCYPYGAEAIFNECQDIFLFADECLIGIPGSVNPLVLF